MDYIQQFFREFLDMLESTQLPEFGLWKYIFLAGLVAIEGPVATLLGAAAAAIGVMQLKFVFVSASLGNLTADTLWYGLGYAGKQEWLFQIGRWLGLRRRDFLHLRERMHQYAPKILLVAKITSGLIIPSLVTAGLVRVPWRKWFPSVAIGELLWTGTLVVIGYHAAHLITHVEKDIQAFVFGSTFLFLLVLVFLIRRFLQRRTSPYRSEPQQGEDFEAKG